MGDAPEWLDTKALLAAAVERRVAYVPGTAFYPDGRGANQMRLAFCYPTEDRIREGISRLGALLHDDRALPEPGGVRRCGSRWSPAAEHPSETCRCGAATAS